MSRSTNGPLERRASLSDLDQRQSVTSDKHYSCKQRRGQSCPALIKFSTNSRATNVPLRRRRIPQLLVLTAISDGDRKRSHRMSRSHGFLDAVDLDENFEHAPRSQRVYAPINDHGHEQPLRSRRNTAYSRSMEDLLSVGLDNDPVERWDSHSSLASEELLSQESQDRELQAWEAELQDDLPINTTSVDEGSTANEDDGADSLFHPYPPPHDQLVAGVKVPTCKCVSDVSCRHICFWKGKVTEDYNMKISNDGGDLRDLPLESSMVIAEEDMEKVCRMCPQSVFTQPF